MSTYATVENESELAEKIKILSQKALETLARDEKIANGKKKEGERTSLHSVRDGLNKPKIKAKSLRAQNSPDTNGVSVFSPAFSRDVANHAFSLFDEVIIELNRLHAQGHDVNKILLELLKQRKEKIEHEKEAQSRLTTSLYIPVRGRAILKEEFGQKCSIPTCRKSAYDIHHTQRFALTHTHDSHYMAPLCREHHQIAHLIDQSYAP